MARDLEEIGIEGALTETGGALKARSRFVSALDEFGGNLVDLVGIGIDGLNERRRARNKARLDLIEMSDEELVKEFAVRNPEVAKLLRAQVLCVARNEDRIEEVVVGAIPYLPSPKEDLNDGSDETIDAEWIEEFERNATSTSSETFQALWSQVLAAKSISPQAFPISSIKKLSDLDQETATGFEKLLLYEYLDSMILLKESPKGQDVLDILNFEALGLIVGGSGNMGLSQDLEQGREVSFEARGRILVVRGSAKKSIRLNFAQLTQFGRDISSIVKRGSPEKLFDRIAEYFGSDADEILDGRITARSGNQTMFDNVRVLKAKA